ncbi:MAG: hypothetical protein K5776_04880 [Lachnospiraceae bacterium]|nr:hypothetical protein [Lachnospiraceae bacterium]
MADFKVEKIYFDMDGVLADFERGVKELCHLTPPDQNSKVHKPGEDDEMWARIKEIGNFYDRLELMPGAKEMFDLVYNKYKDKCEILTGIPKENRGIVTAGEDKKKWVKRLLSEDIEVQIVYREDKRLRAENPGCILIDDMEKNIKEWEVKGTGILNVNAYDTIRRLMELGILDYDEKYFR